MGQYLVTNDSVHLVKSLLQRFNFVSKKLNFIRIVLHKVPYSNKFMQAQGVNITCEGLYISCEGL